MTNKEKNTILYLLKIYILEGAQKSYKAFLELNPIKKLSFTEYYLLINEIKLNNNL